MITPKPYQSNQSLNAALRRALPLLLLWVALGCGASAAHDADSTIAGTNPASLVDIEAGTSEPYPDLDGTIMVSSQEWETDGVACYEKNPEGYVVGGTSEIVELRPEGIVSKFTVPGLWGFGRIR